jgi:hypothetical protein
MLPSPSASVHRPPRPCLDRLRLPQAPDRPYQVEFTGLGLGHHAVEIPARAGAEVRRRADRPAGSEKKPAARGWNRAPARILRKVSDGRVAEVTAPDKPAGLCEVCGL